MRPPSDKALDAMNDYQRWSALEDVIRHYLRWTAEWAGPEWAENAPLEPDDLYGSHSDHVAWELEEMVERLRDAATELEAAVIRRKRRIGDIRTLAALDNVAGRTPEEAEAFRRKAAELRARDGAA